MMKLETVRDNYLDIVRGLAEDHELIIYGAGIYGKRMLSFLQKEGIKISGFAVSESVTNMKEIQGIPVYDILRWRDSDNKEKQFFLIGALKPAGLQIKERLNKEGISNMIDLPDGFDLILDKAFFKPIMEITPLAGCAVNCRYCPQKKFLTEYYRRTDKHEMSFDEFKICIDKTPDDLIVDFSGFVEPFLAKDAVKMIRYCSEKGHAIRLFTTLRGLTMEKYRQIEDIEFDMVVLHLPDKKGYAQIPVDKEYLKLLEVFAARKKADGSSFVDLANSQAEPDDRIVELINNRFPISWQLIDRAGNIQENEGIESARHINGGLICVRAAGVDHNVLLPNGDVVLCCMDFGMRHVLGNLLKGTYQEVCKGKEYMSVRKSMVNGDDCLCRKCTAARPVDE